MLTAVNYIKIVHPPSSDASTPGGSSGGGGASRIFSGQKKIVARASSGAECTHEKGASSSSLALALLGARGILAQSTAAPAQTSTALPTFELDKTWPPKLPNDWVMGQMSSVAIDKRDHVWLLHRPRFISAEQTAHRAPPVLEFDAAGKFVQGWGGSGAGYEWPENEHGIFVDDKDVVWIGAGGNRRGRRHKEGGQPACARR
jgi:hypothetical protein